MTDNESYANEKAREGKAILRWLFKAALMLAILGAITYFFDGELTISALIGSILFYALVRWILNTMTDNEREL